MPITQTTDDDVAQSDEQHEAPAAPTAEEQPLRGTEEQEYEVYDGIRYLRDSMVPAPLADGPVPCIQVRGQLHEIMKEGFDKAREACIWARDEHGFKFKYLLLNKGDNAVTKVTGVPVRKLLPSEAEKQKRRV